MIFRFFDTLVALASVLTLLIMFAILNGILNR